MQTITISIVSHNQASLVQLLLSDLKAQCNTYPLKVTITLNLPEKLNFKLSDYPFPTTVIENESPKGFSANHNQAFKRSDESFFCVMNPDIRIHTDPFPALLLGLQNASIGLVAPLIIGEHGLVEDSARTFPTPFRIICKLFKGCKGGDYAIKNDPIFPDGVGGMFMLFPRAVFEKLGGFNERFFLYYEDVDLCARLRLLGYEVALYPRAQVNHDARRSSHASFKYFKWHLSSMLRFFCSVVFLQVIWRKVAQSKVQ